MNPLLLDACVLIDFIKSDPLVLALIAKHVGPVHVIQPIIAEVNQLDEDELTELGVIIVEPVLEDLYPAASVTGSTSFPDRLCALSAKRFGYTCVTNDKAFRRYCDQEKVPKCWGLQLLSELHKNGGMPAADAIDIARRIHESNPRHVGISLLEKFIEGIHLQENRKGM